MTLHEKLYSARYDIAGGKSLPLPPVSIPYRLLQTLASHSCAPAPEQMD